MYGLFQMKKYHKPCYRFYRFYYHDSEPGEGASID